MKKNLEKRMRKRRIKRIRAGDFPPLSILAAEAAAVSTHTTAAEEQKNDPDTAVIVAESTAVMSPTSTAAQK